jgi:hypothetical protein
MEEKAKRDADKLEVSDFSRRDMLFSYESTKGLLEQQQKETQKREQERLALIAEQENAKLAARIQEEYERRASLIREAYQSEKLRQKKEEDSALRGGRRQKLAPGVLTLRDGKRSVQFGDSTSQGDLPDAEHKIEMPGYSGYWPVWIAFGPPIRKEPLWTAYEVEGSQVVSHADSKPTPKRQDSGYQPSTDGGISSHYVDPPVCSLIVIDFLSSYYESNPGRQKIEKVHEEVRSVSLIKHVNLVQIHATKASGICLLQNVKHEDRLHD